MKISLSKLNLTEANVADLRAINMKMQELTERAERIIKGTDEVFPQAKSGWLRNIKAALGLLPIKFVHTLDETINYCERLVQHPAMASEASEGNEKVTVLFEASPWRDTDPVVYTEYVYAKKGDSADALNKALMSAARRVSEEDNHDMQKVMQFMHQTKKSLAVAPGFVSMTASKKIQKRRSK